MIADFFFRNSRLLVLCLLLIVGFGVSSAMLLPRIEDPLLSQRVGVISTSYPAANPQRIETELVIPLEEAVGSISEVKQLRSNCRANVANIVIELEDHVTDVDAVWSVVRERIEATRPSLPAACDAPQLEVFPLKAHASIIAVRRNMDSRCDVSTWRRLSRKLRAEILNLPGTESVHAYGDPGEEILIEVDPKKLVATGLSIGAIADQLQDRNSLPPAGRIEDEANLLLVNLESDDDPVERLSTAKISLPRADTPIALSDIATINVVTGRTPESLAFSDGQPAIYLAAMVDEETHLDSWASQLKNVAQEFTTEYGESVVVESRFSQSRHIEKRVNSLLLSLAFSAAAVVLCVFFMMGWRSMLVVGATLPLAVCLVLTAMRWLQIPIHQMSVTGLIVALGLLIDNAIVVVDEVRSRVRLGESIGAAVQSAVNHLRMPLIGSTVTTVLAFLPIATLPGPAGEFVGTIAVSVILAIVASLLLALTLIPAMFGMLSRIRARQNNSSEEFNPGFIKRLYLRSLQLVIKYPLLGIALSVPLPIFGFVVANNLPTQFFPPTDRNQIQIELEQPSTSTLESVRATVEEVEQLIAEDGRIESQNWFIGSSAPTFYYNVVPRRRKTPFYAQAFIDLDSSTDPQSVVADLQTKLDKAALDSRIIVRRLEQGPPFDAPVELRIFGPDNTALRELGSQLRLILSETKHVLHTRSDLEDTNPELTFKVDRAVANQANLEDAEIARFLFASTEGISLGNANVNEDEIPVHLQVKLDSNAKLSTLRALTVPSANAASPGRPSQATSDIEPMFMPVTLGSLGEFEMNSEVAAIVRIDGRRVNEVKAYIDSNTLPSVVLDDFRAQLRKSEFTLPANYELEVGGESEKRNEAVHSLIANAILLFALMLVTLVLVFRSFRSALIITCVGGLTIGLGPLALWLFGFPFGFMAIVGIMGLVGVAINDSIVVLSGIRADTCGKAASVEEIARVVFGCSRHVFATTLTTIVGFLPLLINGGAFWPPLAICIAGGVGGATLLALYFVPAIYRVLYLPRLRGRSNYESQKS